MHSFVRSDVEIGPRRNERTRERIAWAAAEQEAIALALEPGRWQPSQSPCVDRAASRQSGQSRQRACVNRSGKASTW